MLAAPEGSDGGIGPRFRRDPALPEGELVPAAEDALLHGTGEEAPLAPLPDRGPRGVEDHDFVGATIGEAELQALLRSMGDHEVEVDRLPDTDVEDPIQWPSLRPRLGRSLRRLRRPPDPSLIPSPDGEAQSRGAEESPPEA